MYYYFNILIIISIIVIQSSYENINFVSCTIQQNIDKNSDEYKSIDKQINIARNSAVREKGN